MQLPKVPVQAERLRLGHGLLTCFLWPAWIQRVQPLPCYLPSLFLSLIGKTGHCEDRTVPLRRLQSHGAGRPATRHSSWHQHPGSVLLELPGRRQQDVLLRSFLHSCFCNCWFLLWTDPSGTHVSGVQSDQGWSTAKANGEDANPAEPVQRTWAHCHEGGDCLPEESK